EHVPVAPWEVLDPEHTHQIFDGPQRTLFQLSLPDRLRRAAATVYHQSGSDEWYTPSDIIECARRVLGEIDLDPASCPRANRTVKAAHYYSRQQNGLNLPWFGRVWMNPPYGGAAESFALKLIAEHQSGHVAAAVAL